MTWVLFKLYCKKSWAWLKHNWKIPAILAWTIIVYISSKGNSQAMEDVIKANRKAHRDEVEALRRAHSDEVLKLKNLQEQYQETVKHLEAKFQKENKELTEKQTEEVKKVIIKSKGNPDEIKKRIEKEFGIKFA